MYLGRSSRAHPTEHRRARRRRLALDLGLWIAPSPPASSLVLLDSLLGSPRSSRFCSSPTNYMKVLDATARAGSRSQMGASRSSHREGGRHSLSHVGLLVW